MKFNAVLILAILLIANACPDKEPEPDYILEIKNNSLKDIIYTRDKLYPDTSLWILNPFESLNIEQFIIPANSVKNIDFYDDEFAKMDDSQKIRLFLFDKEIINTVPWETIKSSYMILKRYDLNLEDFEKMNWKITYP